jgi:methylated-DNA-[protein]-cysteine S-methyltransferase
MNAYVIVDSPIGRLLLQTDGVSLTGLYMDVPGRPFPGMNDSEEDANTGPLPEAVRQLEEYFAGNRRDFDLPLYLNGTLFQQRVWRALTEIPYGETWSYGELAKRIGNPNASRAVGLANGRNPIAILVPCHRVIGADGSLTGYGGGVERKQWLLAHEGLHQFGRPAERELEGGRQPPAEISAPADPRARSPSGGSPLRAADP